MKIFKNLTNYLDSNLEIVNIEGREYRTDVDFNPSAIVPQSFGSMFDKNSYNQVIAQGIKDVRNFFQKNYPAVVESEFKTCLDYLGENNFYCFGEEYEKNSLKEKVALSPKGSQYVYEEARKLIGYLGLDDQKIIYVGHPAHAQRFLAISKKLGMDGVPFVPTNIEWATADTQPWIKSPCLWVPEKS